MKMYIIYNNNSRTEFSNYPCDLLTSKLMNCFKFMTFLNQMSSHKVKYLQLCNIIYLKPRWKQDI